MGILLLLLLLLFIMIMGISIMHKMMERVTRIETMEIIHGYTSQGGHINGVVVDVFVGTVGIGVVEAIEK